MEDWMSGLNQRFTKPSGLNRPREFESHILRNDLLLNSIKIQTMYEGAPKPENNSEKSPIKEGVDFVFEQTSELAEIGTKEQYSEYLDTIFSESKVRDIVYHVSSNKFSEFKDPSSSGLSHIWFSEKPLKYQFGENVYPVLLNIKNPLNESDSNYREEINSYENPINPDWANNYHLTGELPQYKYDGSIRASRVDDGKSITVRNPNQIHILGSKTDIEKFKEFLG